MSSSSITVRTARWSATHPWRALILWATFVAAAVGDAAETFDYDNRPSKLPPVIAFVLGLTLIVMGWTFRSLTIAALTTVLVLLPALLLLFKGRLANLGQAKGTPAVEEERESQYV